ncbi:NLI interacting factor-like phosphatase family protein, putative [Ichthyophthirius multifiliis]|uniref:NLI interacting factor-like phosphatase family protein, putative n=1 Tax=Ichthyophthirius multifiliis TaxID=5932 RepID=G0QLQ3_ICHMU|nr:NLI interacting factor-like phosphatase family protein, putative [Ichthyophthirius multifiliis]EGR33849.1 NLI interacting factor-like phosphatase family protein, putative [Ichthyophthirius multifiliis]|eukprot:XP_004039073.1 NLI interacting factor-like phosphatase family protein, putative [Ichthyophthirius multifiliis]
MKSFLNIFQTVKKQRIKQLGQQKQSCIGKKTLILDLDETLVHSSFQQINEYDFQFEIVVKNIPYQIYVKKRPGIHIFLQKLSEKYEIVIYTASISEYANQVCNIIDQQDVISYRLFRQHCSNYRGKLVKDLTKLGRELKDIIIIDNSENSFLFQPENSIQISNFFEDNNDTELTKLIPFLIFLSDVYDIRSTRKWMEKYINNEIIDYIDMNHKEQKYNRKMYQKINQENKIPQQISKYQIQSLDYLNGNKLQYSEVNLEQQVKQQYFRNKIQKKGYKSKT